ncbi:MAG: DGQHR domain-containing protein [Planctomycetes bacterium]|nr:DGQHR domain-containing protein [Planctomycetota bacterium]
MAVVSAALTGKMGSTDYYLTTIRARELCSLARAASERDDWSSWSIEERLQREVNEKRIRDEIVPYLRNSPDRFFGSLILLVYEPDVFEFEPVEEIGATVPVAYRGVATRMGFLTIDGGDLIVLDGQHRLLAFRAIVEGVSDLGRGASGKEVGEDDVSVIFIRFENSQKTRRIFNKVNRQAKPTSRADNIITSEDDGYAIVCRRLLTRDEPLGQLDLDGEIELINWKSNTISEGSTKLTAISAVYDTCKSILNHYGVTNFDEKSRVTRPEEEELDEVYGHVALWWTTLMNELEPYAQARANPARIPEMRVATEPYSLLFKPVGLMALVKGMTFAMDRSDGELDLSGAIARASLVDWRSDPPGQWRETIVRADGRMSAAAGSINIAAELVAYLIGSEYMTDEELENFTDAYHHVRDEDERDDLPERVPGADAQQVRAAIGDQFVRHQPKRHHGADVDRDHAQPKPAAGVRVHDHREERVRDRHAERERNG